LSLFINIATAWTCTVYVANELNPISSACSLRGRFMCVFTLMSRFTVVWPHFTPAYVTACIFSLLSGTYKRCWVDDDDDDDVFLLPTPTAVARVGFLRQFLYFPHDISKIDAAGITKLDTEMCNDECSISFFWGQKVKVTSHKNSVAVGLCTPMSAVFFWCISFKPIADSWRAFVIA